MQFTQPTRTITVSEGVFNALAEEKDTLDSWDSFLMQRVKGKEGKP